MAKDRFSKFKKSNYNSSFRYGNNSMNYVGVGKREKLSEIQREYLLGLIALQGMPEYSKKFLRSILVENKVPTQKQKEVIKKIVNSTIKNG